MSGYDVFCYGEIGIDNIIQLPHLPSPELAAFPTADSYHVGGAAANTALWLARFGFTVGLSGNVVGDDWHGRQLWRALQQHPSLDLQHVQRQEGASTPFCRVMVTPDGERSFLILGYPQAAKTALTRQMLGSARFLALDLYGGEERLQAARVARSAGVLTTCGDVVDLEHPVLSLTDIATNSGAFTRQAFPGSEARAHAHKLQRISGGIVIGTDGANEVYTVDRDGSAFTVQPPAVNVVDATGAGDAFRAGLLAGMLRGCSLHESVRWGVAAGSLKVQHTGAATIIPSLQEVTALANTLR